jgi:hypothetical protein
MWGFSVSFFVLGILAVSPAWADPSPAKENVYFTLDEGAARVFPGESLAPGHESELQGFDFEMVIAPPANTVQVTKKPGAADASLAAAEQSAETIRRVVFRFFDETDPAHEQLVRTVTLNNAEILDIRPLDDCHERVRFKYESWSNDPNPAYDR